MKIYLLLCVAILGAAFHSLRASMIIDRIGSFNSGSSHWTVTIHQDKPSKFANFRNSNSTTISPSTWRPHRGWFVFIESDSRLWAFDGAEMLLFIQISDKRTTLYDLHSLPVIPPTEILERLPKSVRQKVIFKFKKSESKEGKMTK